jgi:predicted nuclease of predicted toxin-antitoxin system
MQPPRLHLNEHLSPRLAEQLRKYGFDVSSTLEAGMVEASDAEQLAYAAANKRAIVTFNHRDFVVLHEHYLNQGLEH